MSATWPTWPSSPAWTNATWPPSTAPRTASTAPPAVTLALAKRAGANAVVVAEEILHQVAAMEGWLIPDSVEVEVTRDYGETANEKANELLFHLGLATVSIVLLVCWPSAGARRWWWPS
jgi:multidrug efflux pump subunit AcrB